MHTLFLLYDIINYGLRNKLDATSMSKDVTHAHVHIHPPTYTHTLMHPCMDAHMRARMHAHRGEIYIYTHTVFLGVCL